ncbi:peptide transporter family 1 isoform X2 [Megachile rotundata]|uniref:peptide transporter family 1 isoform X2 n=1 Tax=Megachile rotundata TaxID=143995 RepID=UPI003FD0AC78
MRYEDDFKGISRHLLYPQQCSYKLEYPKAVAFIVSNEFCERFSFYGIRTALTIYLRNYLNYEDSITTTIFHVFVMLAYFFPVFGAILADSWLGKFNTIFYLSIVYAIGQILLTLSAAPIIGLPPREFSLIGLFLITIGTGGIKTCVAAFGGDQFVLPQQERYLSTFFSIFYFSINAGSLISSFLTPLLRSEVSCFGGDCYSLAFLVPAVLMIISILIFVFGKPMYRILQPKGNVVVDVSKCVAHAISRKINPRGAKREHWLDYADDEYDKRLIRDIKGAIQVMKLFLPIPIFWALFDQQGTRWTIQATRMTGQIGSFTIQPDQMQVVNPLLVLAFIPLFEAFIYPVLNKIGIHTPLRKLTVGGVLAALSFVASALVELELEKTDPILPSNGLAQLRIFNTLNCPVDLQLNSADNFIIKNLDMYENREIAANGVMELSYKTNFANCFDIPNTEGTITVKEAVANSWVITPNGLTVNYDDNVEKSKSGRSLVRGLIYKSNSVVTLESVKKTYTLNISDALSPVPLPVEVDPETYDIRIDSKVVSKVEFKIGGVYTLVGSVMGGSAAANVVTVTTPNSMHMLWMIPQYVIITMGEIMFSVTGLEFAFTQAPISMKALLQATWLLTTAFGNLIVVIIVLAGSSSVFSRMFYEFLLFAGLMFVSMIIFAIMATFYKYVDPPEEEPVTEEIDLKCGNINMSYKDDEK